MSAAEDIRLQQDVSPALMAVRSSVLFGDLPVIDNARLIFVPGRARAFGQAVFAVHGWPEQRQTFEVKGWADSRKRRCAKKDATFAVIYCARRMLLRLSPNARTERQPPTGTVERTRRVRTAAQRRAEKRGGCSLQ
jgi:hypothetical protein